MVKDNIVILPHILGIFTNFVGPLITYLVGEGDLKKHSKKALNWQLSLLIYSFIAGILMFVLIGFLLLGILWILNVIFCIIATVKASNGEEWEYPLTINFL